MSAVRWIFSISLLLMLASCLPEKKLAREFVEKHPTFHLMVLAPDLLYKYNHKGEEIEGFDTLTVLGQDSALYAGSRYIRYVSDSIFLERYMNQFLDELRLLGFEVYLSASMDTFLKGNPQSYLLNVAQLQLDEYIYLHEDRQQTEDSIYYRAFPLNAVDFSAWFELSRINSDNSGKRLLYSTHTAVDDFDGYFYMDPWSMNVSYKYQHDTLTLEKVYEMASVIGRRHAGYLFDFFMNQYILFHLAPGSFIPYYYRYYRPGDQLIPTDDDRFEILE